MKKFHQRNVHFIFLRGKNTDGIIDAEDEGGEVMNYSGYQVFPCFSMCWKSVERWNPGQPKTATLPSLLDLNEMRGKRDGSRHIIFKSFPFFPPSPSSVSLPYRWWTFLIFIHIYMSNHVYTETKSLVWATRFGYSLSSAAVKAEHSLWSLMLSCNNSNLLLSLSTFSIISSICIQLFILSDMLPSC